jgi:hypothetical protein
LTVVQSEPTCRCCRGSLAGKAQLVPGRVFLLICLVDAVPFFVSLCSLEFWQLHRLGRGRRRSGRETYRFSYPMDDNADSQLAQPPGAGQEDAYPRICRPSEGVADSCASSWSGLLGLHGLPLNSSPSSASLRWLLQEISISAATVRQDLHTRSLAALGPVSADGSGHGDTRSAKHEPASNDPASQAGRNESAMGQMSSRELQPSPSTGATVIPANSMGPHGGRVHCCRAGRTSWILHGLHGHQVASSAPRLGESAPSSVVDSVIAEDLRPTGNAP